MPINDKQANREYQREWERRKRLGLETKGIRKRKPAEPDSPDKRQRARELYNKNAKKRSDIRKEKRNAKKEKLNMLIGSKCILCDSERSLVAHEIHGIQHNGNGSDLFVDAFERPDDFVRLCYSCHKGVHWAMKFMGMSWEDINKNLK